APGRSAATIKSTALCRRCPNQPCRPHRSLDTVSEAARLEPPPFLESSERDERSKLHRFMACRRGNRAGTVARRSWHCRRRGRRGKGAAAASSGRGAQRPEGHKYRRRVVEGPVCPLPWVACLSGEGAETSAASLQAGVRMGSRL